MVASICRNSHVVCLPFFLWKTLHIHINLRPDPCHSAPDRVTQLKPEFDDGETFVIRVRNTIAPRADQGIWLLQGFVHRTSFPSTNFRSQVSEETPHLSEQVRTGHIRDGFCFTTFLSRPIRPKLSVIVVNKSARLQATFP
jgi:hypothetical protein